MVPLLKAGAFFVSLILADFARFLPKFCSFWAKKAVFYSFFKIKVAVMNNLTLS